MSSTKQSKNPLFALVDCNSFFVSCERVFNSQLHKKPVVVLSGNDGCVIARSPEAKKLGIPMGAAAFEYRHLFEIHKVHTFSSNFTLYADMSNRVMNSLSKLAQQMQKYSIDEAFLILDAENAKERAEEIKKKVLQWTGIPVSIGIGRSKTLAKVANYLAKEKSTGIFALETPEDEASCLAKLPVGEVWGIGARTAHFLRSQSIFTADQFRKQDDAWIKKQMSVVGLRMAWELRGIPCLPLSEEPVPSKSIITSRTFGKKITSFSDLAEAISSFTSMAAEDLREQQLSAYFIEVFVETNRYAEQNFYSNRAIIQFPEPSFFTPYLITQAKDCLRAIFREGLSYRRAGIMLGGLIPASSYQMDLFADRDRSTQKQRKLMETLDALNNKLGYKALKFAAEGLGKNPWASNRQHASPRFTSCWDEILTIRI